MLHTSFFIPNIWHKNIRICEQHQPEENSSSVSPLENFPTTDVYLRTALTRIWGLLYLYLSIVTSPEKLFFIPRRNDNYEILWGCCKCDWNLTLNLASEPLSTYRIELYQWVWIVWADTPAKNCNSCNWVCGDQHTQHSHSLCIGTNCSYSTANILHLSRHKQTKNICFLFFGILTLIFWEIYFNK